MSPPILLERADPKQSALVILDVQRGSWPPKGRSGGEEMLPELIALIRASRAVNLSIVFVRNMHSDWTDLANRRDQNERFGASDLSIRYREGTPGVDFLDGLDPEPGDLIYAKHSYSPFAHGPMDLALRSRGIKTVLLTGGSLLGAVETCAKDAYVRGYHVVVVKDCVHPRSGRVYDVVIDYLDKKIGMVVSSQELMACWTKG